jgi:hypothetical protein
MVVSVLSLFFLVMSTISSRGYWWFGQAGRLGTPRYLVENMDS